VEDTIKTAKLPEALLPPPPSWDAKHHPPAATEAKLQAGNSFEICNNACFVCTIRVEQFIFVDPPLVTSELALVR